MKKLISFYNESDEQITFDLDKLFGVIKKQDIDGVSYNLSVAGAETISIFSYTDRELCEKLETFFNENKVFDESWCKIVIPANEDKTFEETIYIKASYVSFINYDEASQWLSVVTSSNYDFNISEMTPEVYKPFYEDWRFKVSAGYSYETIELNTRPVEEEIIPPVA